MGVAVRGKMNQITEDRKKGKIAYEDSFPPLMFHFEIIGPSN